jgi:hypothetical protein
MQGIQGLQGERGDAGPGGVMGYAQSTSTALTGGIYNHLYPLTMNSGAGTKCLISVTGWLNTSVAITGNNQTYPSIKAQGAANPGAPTSFGCYHPQPPPSGTFSTCSYTYVATVTPNTNYEFGCMIFPSANNASGYCAAAAQCF